MRAEKVKIVCFARKLAHMMSRGCGFLFRHYFSEFPILNPFLGKFGPKNSKFLVFPENWNTWYLEDADSYSDIIFNPNSVFGQIWTKKIQSCPFCLKIGTHGILKEMIPNPELDFRNSDARIHFWASLRQRNILCLF